MQCLSVGRLGEDAIFLKPALKGRVGNPEMTAIKQFFGHIVMVLASRLVVNW